MHGDKDYRGMIGAEYKNKNKKFDISLDETGRVNVGANLKFNKGGCPHREVGAKSDIQGVKDIQVKGKKFTGSV